MTTLLFRILSFVVLAPFTLNAVNTTIESAIEQTAKQQQLCISFLHHTWRRFYCVFSELFSTNSLLGYPFSLCNEANLDLFTVPLYWWL